MGMHDNPEYLIKNKMEFEIKAASENAEDSVRIREELDEKFKRNTETMRTAVTTNELRGIASTLSRRFPYMLIMQNPVAIKNIRNTSRAACAA
ncbi:hypothetical protein WKR00_15055 [Morganella morganii]|uniref:hypothetical protein n=1 Tax=Morganella morganii TaxID=582 RepID=UPI00324BD569